MTFQAHSNPNHPIIPGKHWDLGQLQALLHVESPAGTSSGGPAFPWEGPARFAAGSGNPRREGWLWENLFDPSCAIPGKTHPSHLSGWMSRSCPGMGASPGEGSREGQLQAGACLPLAASFQGQPGFEFLPFSLDSVRFLQPGGGFS